MKQAAAARLVDRVPSAKLMIWSIGALLLLHFAVCLFSGSVTASRSCTAAVAFLASGCVVLRIRALPWPERLRWFWGAAGIFLWATAHATETFIGRSAMASNLAVDAADFVYIAAIFPLLLVFSSTHETQFLRPAFLLNCFQLVLAAGLAYVLLYRMAMPAGYAATVMGRIYGVACSLIAVMSLVRGLTWLTHEERRCIRWISIFLWIYLPIELGMDYASRYHDLRAGTLLDLLWSVPFVLTGWKALTLPIDAFAAEQRVGGGRLRLLVECLCPLLINAGIFALAAAIAGQHLKLGLLALFALMLIQGVQGAFIQMHYLSGRRALLNSEKELRDANEALQELSLRDPLTGIANRRHFDAELEEAWKRALRKRDPLTLLMIDIDFFKGVNDSHGHGYGDECLITLANMLHRHARRPGDLVARLGGEEFVFLLPDTDLVSALPFAAQLQEAIRVLDIRNQASPFDGRITASIGVATAIPAAEAQPGMLVDTADRALYTAKANGRNRAHAIQCSQEMVSQSGIGKSY